MGIRCPVFAVRCSVFRQKDPLRLGLVGSSEVLGEWMQREIEEQPALLARLSSEYLAQLSNIFRGQAFEAILLTARGSSDHAALYARYLIEVHLHIPVILAAPSVLTRYGSPVRYPRCLAIGISQSGSAPDVSEVLSYMRKEGHSTLAITNTPGSRLDKEAEHSLYLDVGDERSVAATKTYSASLLALYQVVACLGGQLASPVLPDAKWHEMVSEQAHHDAPKILAREPIFALGRGYSFSTANETALKLMECALVPCRAYSSADFEHGPKALADAGSAIISFGQVSESLASQGGLIVQAPEPVGVPEECEPMWHAIYGQWLALCCARLRGEDPDQPQFIHKVTKTL
jgi:glutamine---fructose-6-phosphate transaminase (isomerizing)